MDPDPDRCSSMFYTIEQYTIQLIDKYWDTLKFTSKEFVLDIGCGPGALTRNVLLPKMENYLDHLVAVDDSTAMIGLARMTNRHPLISYMELDFGKPIDNEAKKTILFGKEGFHKIFCICSLNQIPDQRQFAKNIFTLLKPGGEAFLVLVAKSTAFEIGCELSKSNKWNTYLDVFEHVSYYQHLENPEKEFKKLFEAEGLNFKLCSLENFSAPFQDMDDFFTFIIETNPFLKSAPEDTKMDFILDAMSVINLGTDEMSPIFEYSVIIAHVSKP